MVKNSSKQSDTEKKRVRRIIYILAIIIFILLIITSCNSEFFGRIGSLFHSSSNHTIGDNDKTTKVIMNKELSFDASEVSVYLHDDSVKLTYKTLNIKTDTFTCTTDDASIATCYIDNDYVVIKPQKVGNTAVYIYTDINGVTYKAKADVKVLEDNRGISLGASKGTINLHYGNGRNVPFNLNGIKGKVTATSSDETVATVKVKDGHITITGHKTGTSIIKLKVKDGNKEYTTEYKVVITDYEVTTKPKTTTTKKTKKITTTSTTTTKKTEPLKSNDSSLSSISSNIGSLTPSFNKNIKNYGIVVTDETTSINLNVKKSSNKASIKYFYKDIEVNSLNNLELAYGDNLVEVIVIAEDNTQSTYKVIINRPKSKDADLKKLTTNKGTLTPSFSANVIAYTIEVENNVENITLTAEKKNNKASISYKYKDVLVDNLNNLNLDYGNNVVEVIVTAQDGTKKTYTVTIKRMKSDNAYLSNLSITNKTLTPTFNKNTYEYTVNTSYDDSIYNLVATKDESNSTITYKLNGNVVTDPSNLNLINGDNIIEVIVTAQNGTTKNIYKINAHKPVRTIDTSFNTFTINMDVDTIPYNIAYIVKEDDIEIDNYTVDQIDTTISSDFTGTISKNKGYISLSNLDSCVGKTFTLTIKTGTSQKDVTIKVITNNYFVSTYANNYDLIKSSTNNSKSIIINNNIIISTPTVDSITGGIRIKKDNNHYIDVQSNNPSLIHVSLDDYSSLSSLVVKASTDNTSGTATILIRGFAYGNQVGPDINVTITIKNKLDVTINANNGLFDNVTGEYKYQLDEGTVLNLADYVGLKADDVENCKFFTQKGFSTNKDATTPEYQNNDTITITNNIVLYSIYEDVSGIVDVPSSGTVYLTDVDIFHNEDYMNKYNVDKMIYPGAHGSHELTIKNTGTGDLKITNIRLEEDTICVSSGNCLNMAYTIEQIPDISDTSSSSYIYGNPYQILNRDTNTIYSNELGTYGSLKKYHTTRSIPVTNITIPVNTEAGYIVYWKWVSVDDDLDTKIGSQNENIDYTLTLSLDYDRTDINCNL